MRISDWSSDVCPSDLAGDGAERDLLARRRQDRQASEFADTVAQLARIADADRVAREPLDRLADRLAADRAGDDGLHVGDIEAVARRRGAIDVDVDIAPAGQPFGQDRKSTRLNSSH